ncbi:hypothetical protein JCM21714_2129 [Gracilibacillus boraciitolerans JCM 21714]|uniref:Uncharacterized protein n=1 Tax=Gracilibacillus boraciitolerans JCM 21714 TaxID=1298598 RepID=W4VIQ6_9BACI|nr:hypothetical protein [Gracilibacillus boraciitolerans]GAE93092.1 hypothetical protein JCM21714_2129 [Gracilibacillus boraciitolerans JCM 21714]
MRFISLLDGKSEEKLIEQVRKKSGSTYKKHPAEQLTRSQLELIGYPKIDWIKNRDYDVELYKNYRERVYQDWTSHVKKEKELCYKLLFTGLLSNNLSSAIASCKQKEFELQEKFVDELIKMLFQESKYEVFEVEMNVSELMKIQHPYDTL